MDSPTSPPLQRSDWTVGCRDTAEGIPAQIHITRAANSNESDTAKRCARVAKTHFSIGAIIINKTWLMPRKKISFIVWSSSCSLLTERTRSRKHKHPDKGWEQKRGHDAENQKAQTRTIYLSGNCQLSASVGRWPFVFFYWCCCLFFFCAQVRGPPQPPSQVPPPHSLSLTLSPQCMLGTWGCSVFITAVGPVSSLVG